MATPEQVATLRHFAWSEFRHPERLHFPFLRWLDDVRARAGVRFVLTSDFRDSIPKGGSLTSLHLQGRAVDIKWPWAALGVSDGRVLAKIVRAVAVVPPPEGEGGWELGLERGAPGGPHVHLGLFGPDRPASWLFTR